MRILLLLMLAVVGLSMPHNEGASHSHSHHHGHHHKHHHHRHHHKKHETSMANGSVAQNSPSTQDSPPQINSTNSDTDIPLEGPVPNFNPPPKSNLDQSAYYAQA